MLGTSDTWSTSHLSQQTSKPAYYIADCRICGVHSLAQLVKVVAIIFPCLIGQLLENPSQLLSAKTAAI